MSMDRILIPTENLIHKGLNSYYIDIQKFIEHHKENQFVGCMHFKSYQMDAVIYFDEDEILSTLFKQKDDIFLGEEAMDLILKTSKTNNYTIDIYEIDPDKIYYWSNLLTAETVYKDLNAEFTDLEGLINKMMTETLTGYIAVTLGNGDEGGFILFHNGKVMPQAFAWKNETISSTPEGSKLLVDRSRVIGGTFHVKKVSPNKETNASSVKHLNDTLRMVEQLLAIIEVVMNENKKFKGQFDTLIKKKFLEKTEKYEFLDPFTSEFNYTNRKATYTGKTSPNDLAKGVLEAVTEFIQEAGLKNEVVPKLDPWKKKYEKRIARAGIPYFQ